MRLLVIRHGETDLNAARRIQGPVLDPPLNARGLAQAQALARRLATDPELPHVDLLLSSPMRRATMTAEPVARSAVVPWEIDDRLVEFDWGELNGRVDEGDVAHELRRQVVRWRDGHLDEAPPGGESPRAAFRRAMEAIEPRLGVVGDGGCLAVVAHGRLNRILLSGLLHGEPRLQDDFHQRNCGLSLLERTDGRWTPARIDDCAHVEGLAGDAA